MKKKQQKINLVPIPRHENLADLFLILPGQLQMSSKRFHLYSFIKLSKNEALRPFLVIFVEWLTWKPRPLWKFWFQFLVNILKLFKGAKFDYDKRNEKNVIWNWNFQIFFVSDHLNAVDTSRTVIFECIKKKRSKLMDPGYLGLGTYGAKPRFALSLKWVKILLDISQRKIP